MVSELFVFLGIVCPVTVVGSSWVLFCGVAVVGMSLLVLPKLVLMKGETSVGSVICPALVPSDGVVLIFCCVVMLTFSISVLVLLRSLVMGFKTTSLVVDVFSLCEVDGAGVVTSSDGCNCVPVGVSLVVLIS